MADSNTKFLLYQLRTLLELTRDIERNQDDAIFHRNGGEISYLFDENVFEVFVRPWEMGHAGSVFHTENWRKEFPWANQKAHIGAQLALLTAELLFSGELPGQRQKSLYITEWHREELNKRIGEMTEDIQNKSRDSGELEALLELLRDQSSAGPSFDPIPPEILRGQPDLRQDLSYLRLAKGERESEIRRFTVARLAARSLALDRIIQPAEQLLRIVTRKELANRLYLATTIRRPQGAEVETLAADAAIWFRRLDDEFQRTQRARVAAGMWNDARSLALVRWLSLRSDPAKHRVVLVTSDTVMFDAYRRWYTPMFPHEERNYEPFLLRRIRQYSPLLNVNDAQSDIRDSDELFVQTRQALETALLPFSFSKLAQRAEDHSNTATSRESIALRLSDAAGQMDNPEAARFLQRFDHGWLDTNRKAIAALHGKWQTAERMVIGSMYDLLSNRMSIRQRAIAQRSVAASPEAAGSIVANYISDLLRRIVKESTTIWLPVAESFIVADANDALLKTIRTRPPIAIRFESEGGGQFFDQSAVVEQWGKGNRKALSDLMERLAPPSRPALVFAIAAILGLVAEDWASADRFSDLALRAETGGLDKPADSHNGAEIQYLRALVKRFRMGEIGIPKGPLAESSLEQNYLEALRLLEASKNYHLSYRHSIEQRICVVRTLSERSALRLFRSVALTDIGRDDAHTTSSTEGVTREQALTTLLEDATSDILQCFALEDELVSSRSLTPENRNFLMQTSRQFISNTAAVHLLTRTAPNIAASLSNRLLLIPDIVSRVRSLLDASFEKLPTVVQAEILLFLRTHDRSLDIDKRVSALFEIGPVAARLPIDIGLFEFAARHQN